MMKNLKFTSLLLLIALVTFMTSCEQDAFEQQEFDKAQTEIEFNESMVDWSEVITVIPPKDLTAEELKKWISSFTQEEMQEIGKVGVDADNQSKCNTNDWIYGYPTWTSYCQRCGSGFVHHKSTPIFIPLCNGTGHYRVWYLRENYCFSYC